MRVTIIVWIRARDKVRVRARVRDRDKVMEDEG